MTNRTAPAVVQTSAPDRADNRTTEDRTAAKTLEHRNPTAPSDPLNRRGRRHLAAQIRRSERQYERAYYRELVEERAVTYGRNF